MGSSSSLDVVAIVGSLRRASFTRALVNAFTPIAPPSLKIEIVGIGDLPLYDEDGEAAPPAAWKAFRERVSRADAVLFATPEYNRSIPGGLKNAIDVGSRPYGKSVWSGKPAAVVSCSPGVIGGFGSNHHLRQCLVFLDMPVLQQPEAYLGNVAKLLGPNGEISDEKTREFCTQLLQKFEAWIQRQRR
jgi:chromate reductase, NAD(P)H dehydrogenase (quinone)